MRKIKIIGAFLATLLLVPSLTVSAADLKIGVVNAAMVLDKSPQKEKALARLEKEFSVRSKSLERKVKDLRARQAKLTKDAAILSADERKTKERSILSEQRDLKRLGDEYSEDLSIRRNEELRKLEKDIAKTIIEVAQKESYDLVLYQGVIHASKSINITDKVLEILKSK